MITTAYLVLVAAASLARAQDPVNKFQLVPGRVIVTSGGLHTEDYTSSTYDECFRSCKDHPMCTGMYLQGMFPQIDIAVGAPKTCNRLFGSQIETEQRHISVYDEETAHRAYVGDQSKMTTLTGNLVGDPSYVNDTVYFPYISHQAEAKFSGMTDGAASKLVIASQVAQTEQDCKASSANTCIVFCSRTGAKAFSFDHSPSGAPQKTTVCLCLSKRFESGPVNSRLPTGFATSIAARYGTECLWTGNLVR